jgi:hypothetical protein
MNRIDLKRISYLIFILIVGFLGGFLATRCATPQKELKTYTLAEINREKVFSENRGLKILKENATMIHDYYRGGVQEKDEGETLMKEGKWEEARKHLEESNRYLQVVVRYLPEDEPSRNVYGDIIVIFMPYLLMADNHLKLITIYKNAKDDNRAAEAKSYVEYYLSKSLQSVNTEWAAQIKKGLEEAFPKK